MTRGKKLTTEEFIERAKEAHGDKYDYSKVKYINSRTKVIIICKKHGEFEQVPAKHLYGSCCEKCSYEYRANNLKSNNESFINIAKEIHKNKYNYSHVEYKNAHIKVIIICPIHGKFKQRPSEHLHGNGCAKCGIKKVSSAKLLNNNIFISRSELKHGNKYDYSKINYVNSKTKVIIICKEHGEFKQRPAKHIHGQGCPKCNTYKGEEKIKLYLKENNVSFTQQKTFKDCKYKALLKFDFYLPDHRALIEFDGEQHFKPVQFAGISLKKAEDNFKEQLIKDAIKDKYCEDNNIELIRIQYTEFDRIEEILKKTLDNK